VLSGAGSTEDGAPEIRLLCKNWHELRCSMSPEEALLFGVTNHPDELLSNPMWLVDDRRRVSYGKESRIWVEPGRRFTLGGEAYDVVAIETDRTLVRRGGRSVQAPSTEGDGPPAPPEPSP
jgi:hypothetical protein